MADELTFRFVYQDSAAAGAGSAPAPSPGQTSAPPAASAVPGNPLVPPTTRGMIPAAQAAPNLVPPVQPPPVYRVPGMGGGNPAVPAGVRDAIPKAPPAFVAQVQEGAGIGRDVAAGRIGTAAFGLGLMAAKLGLGAVPIAGTVALATAAIASPFYANNQAARITNQIAPFSPDIQAARARQAALGIQFNVQRATRFGQTFAELDEAKAEFSRELSRFNTEFAATFAPLLTMVTKAAAGAVEVGTINAAGVRGATEPRTIAGVIGALLNNDLEGAFGTLLGGYLRGAIEERFSRINESTNLWERFLSAGDGLPDPFGDAGGAD